MFAKKPKAVVASCFCSLRGRETGNGGEFKRLDENFFDEEELLVTAETARRTAERLAPAKAGVVAFSTAGDAELGDYDDEPTIIFKTGQLPAHFEDT
jgi:hypothetical protein